MKSDLEGPVLDRSASAPGENYLTIEQFLENVPINRRRLCQLWERGIGDHGGPPRLIVEGRGHRPRVFLKKREALEWAARRYGPLQS